MRERERYEITDGRRLGTIELVEFPRGTAGDRGDVVRIACRRRRRRDADAPSVGRRIRAVLHGTFVRRRRPAGVDQEYIRLLILGNDGVTQKRLHCTRKGGPSTGKSTKVEILPVLRSQIGERYRKTEGVADEVPSFMKRDPKWLVRTNRRAGPRTERRLLGDDEPIADPRLDRDAGRPFK